MPIYAYRCFSCGLHKDVMQKMSDAPLSICPQCGKETFAKQLTAAGFVLKGSGYYVTDFRDGPKKPESGKPEPGRAESESPSETKPETKTDAAVASASSAPSSTASSAT